MADYWVIIEPRNDEAARSVGLDPDVLDAVLVFDAGNATVAGVQALRKWVTLPGHTPLQLAYVRPVATVIEPPAVTWIELGSVTDDVTLPVTEPPPRA
jgi:hypothetical protein